MNKIQPITNDQMRWILIWGLPLLLIIFTEGHLWAQDNEWMRPKFNITDSGFIQVEGGQLFFEKSGKGEPIIFIHDGILHRETYDFQFGYFSQNYTVIRYDRRGYGLSSKPTKPFSQIEDLLAVFKQLNIDRANLIGCSAGGRLSIDFALAYPERVSSLVLVGAVVSGYGFGQHFFTRGGHFNLPSFDNTEEFRNFWYNIDPYSIFEENRQARQYADKLIKANPHNLDRANNGLVQNSQVSAAANLSIISVPALLVIGEYDIPDVHAHAGVIDAGIPNSKRIVLRNAGHLAHMEQPDQFIDLVRNFYAEKSFFDFVELYGIDAYIETNFAGGNFNPDDFHIDEFRLNQFGYERLLSGKVNEAAGFFKLNIILHPNSFNAYDSYGEALLAKGDTANAIVNYKKSLELNPDNQNAAAVLSNLKIE
ncbi:MAG: alpha/beta fold hydrolase [candidate division Zixibacteria bacterium]